MKRHTDVKQWMTLVAATLVVGCGPLAEEQPSRLAGQAEAPTTQARALEGFNPLPSGIDWVVHERFPRDTDGDGVPNERFDEAYLHPAFYEVTLKGCAPGDEPSSGTWSIIPYTYQWTVNGIPVAQPDHCETVVNFPAQGTYDVRLRVTQTWMGETKTAEYQRAVTVKDWLIVSLGDSFGSGEGAPDVPANWGAQQPAKWADARCHRSFKSAAALSARTIEQQDPHSSVTYFSLACSGATISRTTYEYISDVSPLSAFPGFVEQGEGPARGSGLLGGYVGIEPPARNMGAWDPESYLPAQVTELAQRVGSRPVDMLVVSGGGNDTGFGDILRFCYLTQDCHTNVAGTILRGKVDPLKSALAGRYAALSQALQGLSVRDVYVMEYPNFVRNEEGAVCEHILREQVPIALDTYVGRAELTFLEPYVLDFVLGTLRQAASDHGWQYVGGIAADFTGTGRYPKGHGVCAAPSERWFNNGYDAASTQGPKDDVRNTTGKVHPNYRGYEVMSERLLESIRATHAEWVPDGTLLRAYDQDAVYIIFGGAKFHVPTWEHLATVYGMDGSAVRDVPASTLARFSHAPAGWVEGVSGRWGISGWTYDPDSPAQSLWVHAYFDGPSGTGAWGGAFPADRSRDDVNTALGISGRHGFVVPIPAQYYDGRPHTVHIYAIDAQGRFNPELPISSRTFQLGGAEGHVEQVSADGVVQGWALDLNSLDAPITVHFHVALPGEPLTFVGSVTTEVERPDVNAQYGTTGRHGFRYVLPNWLWDGRARSLYVYAIDAQGRHDALLDGMGHPAQFIAAVGHVEPVSAEGILSGWALDPQALGVSLWVDVYVDGPAGLGGFMGRYPTSTYRSEVNGQWGASGNHGFRIPIPLDYQDGDSHALYVYALDADGRYNPLLDNKPHLFTLGVAEDPCGTKWWLCEQ